MDSVLPVPESVAVDAFSSSFLFASAPQLTGKGAARTRYSKDELGKGSPVESKLKSTLF